MGGHRKHLGDVVRADAADLAGVEYHIDGIDHQQACRAQPADRQHVGLFTCRDRLTTHNLT